MSNVIALKPRIRRADVAGDIIRKVVDGKIVECVNFDALTAIEQQRLFSKADEGDGAEAFAPQPVD